MIWEVCLVLGLALCVFGDRRPAISEQRVEYFFTGHHGELSHIGHQQPEHHETYAWAYPSYEFSYSVDDPHTHDVKGQHEVRDGNKVHGNYWLIQPDGQKRLVKYQVDDETGFTAEVNYLPLHGGHAIKESYGSNGYIKEIPHQNGWKESETDTGESVRYARLQEAKQDQWNRWNRQGGYGLYEIERYSGDHRQYENKHNGDNHKKLHDSSNYYRGYYSRDDSEKLEHLKHDYERKDEHIHRPEEGRYKISEQISQEENKEYFGNRGYDKQNDKYKWVDIWDTNVGHGQTNNYRSGQYKQNDWSWKVGQGMYGRKENKGLDDHNESISQDYKKIENHRGSEYKRTGNDYGENRWTEYDEDRFNSRRGYSDHLGHHSHIMPIVINQKIPIPYGQRIN